MIFILRSARARERLYRFDAGLRARAGRNPLEPEVFVRRFEAGIYVVMCLGTALILLGVVVAAT
jgi:hypothetical protein